MRMPAKAIKKATTNAGDQTELLRKARKVLNYSNAELAESLGKKPATLIAWLAPAGAKKRRTMPTGSRLLLERLLADAKRKK